MKFVVRSQLGLIERCSKIPEWDGKPYTVTIEPFKRPRTNPQNAKLHAMIRELAQHTGYTEKEMKDVAKAAYYPSKHLKRPGHQPTKYVVPKSTAELNVEEASEVVERLYQLGAEIGCVFQSA